MLILQLVRALGFDRGLGRKFTCSDYVFLSNDWFCSSKNGLECLSRLLDPSSQRNDRKSLSEASSGGVMFKRTSNWSTPVTISDNLTPKEPSDVARRFSFNLSSIFLFLK